MRWLHASNSSTFLECRASSPGEFQPSWHFEPRNSSQLHRCSRCGPQVNRHRVASHLLHDGRRNARGGVDAAVSCSKNPPSWPNRQVFWCVLRCAVPTQRRAKEAAMQRARNLRTILVELPTPCSVMGSGKTGGTLGMGHSDDEIRGSRSRAMRQESPR